MRALALAVVMLASAAVLAGCEAGYIAHAAYEEGRLLWRRKPIDKVLARGDLPPEVRRSNCEAIGLLHPARACCRQRLDLGREPRAALQDHADLGFELADFRIDLHHPPMRLVCCIGLGEMRAARLFQFAFNAALLGDVLLELDPVAFDLPPDTLLLDSSVALACEPKHLLLLIMARLEATICTPTHVRRGYPSMHVPACDTGGHYPGFEPRFH